MLIFSLLKRADIIGEEIKLNAIENSGSIRRTYFGGLLSICVVGLSIAVFCYFMLALIIKSNPKAFQVTKFLDDAPQITFDDNGIFVSVAIWSGSVKHVDESIVTITGTVKDASSKDPNILNYEFGPCDANDYKGVVSFFKQDLIDSLVWYCIKNQIVNGTRVTKLDPIYIPPFTQHGMSSRVSPSQYYFEIDGDRCLNSSWNNFSCASNETIEQILAVSNYRLHFLDNYYDVTNYQEPVLPFLHEIMGASSATTSAQNYINFNDVFCTTHDGLIFDNPHTLQSWSFQDRIEIVNKYDPSTYGNGHVFMLRLEGQNTPTYYERTYVRLQEVLASIGGVIKVLFLMARILNSMVNIIKIKPFIVRRFFNDFFNNVSVQKWENFSLRKKKYTQTQQNAAPSPRIEIFENSNIWMVDASEEKFPNVIKIEKEENNIKEKTNENSDNMQKNSNLSLWGMIKTRCKEYLFYRRKNKIKNKIFNELTIYKIYFDLEKLKRILLNSDQREAFERIKLSINLILNEKTDERKNMQLIETLIKEYDNKINMNLARLLIES